MLTIDGDNLLNDTEDLLETNDSDDIENTEIESSWSDKEKNQFYKENRPRTIADNSNQKNTINNNFKSNSDIYPIGNCKQAIVNQYHDTKIYMNQLKLFERQKNSIENKKSSLDLSDSSKKNTNLNQIGYKNIQVNEQEINKHLRDQMADRKAAKRLEISEALAEKLVASALLAGSKDNITVNCILFSGSHI